MYDIKIVGAGLFGSVFAEQAASLGKKVLVIDKRDHIAGNCYTKKQHNIDIHKYGPHIFHTNSDRIWNYINKFTDFNNFVLNTKACFCGKYYSLPINLNTFEEFFGVKTEAEARQVIHKKKLKIKNPSNLEEWILSEVGEEIYESLIQGYTLKQWQTDPKNLPSSIIKRLPIRFERNNNYFNDKYQGIPKNGYTAIFEKLLDSPNIEVRTGCEFDSNWKSYAKNLLFTGPIDEYFNFKFGTLEYRGVKFVEEVLNNTYQDRAIINYTSSSVPYTRKIEHKYFNFNEQKKTIVTTEYPTGISLTNRFYPLRDQKNTEIYEKYELLSKYEDNVFFGGRLANYRYWDMDQTIGSSLNMIKKVYNL